MKKNILGILLGFSILFLFSFSPAKEKPAKVALSKASPNYISWIRKGDSSIVVIDLSTLKPEQAVRELEDCAGLVLTGGGDIDPALYDYTGNREDCSDIDRDRDILEKAVISQALRLNMPVLGICRGEQMLNVFMGGSLITDIPSFMRLKHPAKKPVTDATAASAEENMVMEEDADPEEATEQEEWREVIHRCDDYLNCNHTVRVDRSSLLYSIIGFDSGSVTTNHHQAVFRMGKGLKKNSESDDNITEGIEWDDPKGKPFLLGVQWHPERMDISNPFSGKLLNWFIGETRKYNQTLKK